MAITLDTWNIEIEDGSVHQFGAPLTYPYSMTNGNIPMAAKCKLNLFYTSDVSISGFLHFDIALFKKVPDANHPNNPNQPDRAWFIDTDGLSTGVDYAMSRNDTELTKFNWFAEYRATSATEFQVKITFISASDVDEWMGQLAAIDNTNRLLYNHITAVDETNTVPSIYNQTEYIQYYTWLNGATHLDHIKLDNTFYNQGKFGGSPEYSLDSFAIEHPIGTSATTLSTIDDNKVIFTVTYSGTAPTAAIVKMIKVSNVLNASQFPDDYDIQQYAGSVSALGGSQHEISATIPASDIELEATYRVISISYVSFPSALFTSHISEPIVSDNVPDEACVPYIDSLVSDYNDTIDSSVADCVEVVPHERIRLRINVSGDDPANPLPDTYDDCIAGLGFTGSIDDYLQSVKIFVDDGGGEVEYAAFSNFGGNWFSPLFGDTDTFVSTYNYRYFDFEGIRVQESWANSNVLVRWEFTFFYGTYNDVISYFQGIKVKDFDENLVSPLMTAIEILDADDNTISGIYCRTDNDPEFIKVRVTKNSTPGTDYNVIGVYIDQNGLPYEHENYASPVGLSQLQEAVLFDVPVQFVADQAEFKIDVGNFDDNIDVGKICVIAKTV